MARPGKAAGQWTGVVTALVALLLVGGGMGCGQSLPSTPASPGGHPIAEFPVHGDGDLLLVPVHVAGREYSFLLDTGAQCSALDTSHEPILGAPLPATWRVNGELEVKTFPWPAATVGQINVSLPAEARVISLPMVGFREATGHQIDGVLGFDWLQSQILHIDFERGHVQFLREPPAGERVPLEIRDGYAFVRVHIPGCGELPLMVDTGNDSSIRLVPDQYAQLQSSKSFTKVGQVTMGILTATGTVPVEFGVVDYVRLGDHQHSNVVVRSHAARYGIVGLAVLCQQTVTLDFPNRQMYLGGPPKLREAYSWNRSGLALDRHDGRTMVKWVEAGSPAQSKGILVGDEVTTLQGKDVSSLRLFALRRMLSRPGPLRLQVLRNRHVFNVRLELQDWPAADTGGG